MFSQNKDKATLLNKQFQSVFSQLSPLKLSQLCIDKLQDYFSGRIPKKFQCNYPKMPEIIKDLKGILKLLSNLNPDKAPGPDGIKPIVLKELREELTRIIQLLFQKSISTGKIPTDWTKANVSPVFKKGSKSDPANYRPISLTCILCKVIEHIIASKLTQHLNQHIFSLISRGASDYHRTPQDTIGHPRTPQDSTRHHRTVPVHLKLMTFIIFSMLKSLFFMMNYFI